PIDMTANGGPEQYRACLEALCDEPELDAILVIFIPPLVTPSSEVARVIGEVVSARSHHHHRPIAAVFLDSQSRLSVINAGERVVPVYDFPEGAIAAISAAARYGSWRAEPAGHIVSVLIDREAIDRVMANNRAGHSEWISQTDVATLLSAAGIELTPSSVARSPKEAAATAAAFNRPVAMKIIEPAVLHKTDVGGIVLNIPVAEAADGYKRLAKQLAAHGIELAAASVAPMVKPGVEVLAGVTNDQVFGPLVAFGSGGALVELLDDVVFRVLPLTDRDVSEMIAETRVSRLLKGYRGSPPADIAALERLLQGLGALAEAAPRIAEIDLNPAIVHPNGEGISLIDARVRLSD
ncbi:MAG: acetate--CoA ligase family protein, partial [Blastocatellia bacterium]